MKRRQSWRGNLAVDVGAEFAEHTLTPFRAAADDEDRVVTSDGACDVRPFELIERFGHWLRAGFHRAGDDQHLHPSTATSNSGSMRSSRASS